MLILKCCVRKPVAAAHFLDLALDPAECVDLLTIKRTNSFEDILRYSYSILILVMYQIDIPLPSPSLALSLCPPSGLKT